MSFNEDIRSILSRLRARDVEEMREQGFDADAVAAGFATPAVLARIFAHGGRPVAVVTFHAITPKALAVSMVASDEWRSVARAMVRWGMREARPRLLALGFSRAECRTMAGHADAIRLLERFGFSLECRLPGFGASGVTFLQYAWRLNDHVSFQSTEGSPAAATAADTGVQGGRVVA
ncbi:MAG: hypothetical protein ABL996_18120 [Micropepsaceae bacterium]